LNIKRTRIDNHTTGQGRISARCSDRGWGNCAKRNLRSSPWRHIKWLPKVLDGHQQCSTKSCPPPSSPPCSWHKGPYPHPRSRPLVATNHVCPLLAYYPCIAHQIPWPCAQAPPRPFVFFVLSLQSSTDTHIAGLYAGPFSIIRAS
jgi:hypothetical protein